MLNKSGMWAKIKEYSLEWSETSNTKDVILSSIGLKVLMLRRPIDNNVNKRLNFMPYYNEDKYDYIIKGTQLIPIDSNSNEDYVVLENFSQQDFQFKGDIFNTGVKIYMDDHN